MHYKNGREAKNGDKVVLIPAYAGSNPVVGILYNATAGNDYCNGSLALTRPNDPCPNLQECLHLDDVLAMLGGYVRDVSAPIPTIDQLQAILDSDQAGPPVTVQPDGSVTDTRQRRDTFDD